MQVCKVEVLLLLVATTIVHHSTAHKLEYLCSSSSHNTGNFQVTLLLNIHYGPECKQLNPRWPNSILSPEVLKWRMNLQTEIGFNVIDTCGDSDIAAKAIAESIPYSWTLAAPSISEANNSVCTIKTSSPINIGYIAETLPAGYGTTSGLLGQTEVPLIVTSDILMSSQSSDQSTLIAAGDDLQTQLTMMAKLMVKMEWDFVTVVYSDDALGKQSLELFRNVSLKHYICIDKYIAVSYAQLPTTDINTVGVVLLGSEGIGLHSLGQLPSSSKVWVTGHDISGLAISDDVKVYSVVGENKSQYVINSLVSFSKALEEAENKPDCSSGDPQQCVSKPEFRQSLIQKLQAQVNRNLSYSIDSNGNVQPVLGSIDIIYKVYFHKKETTQVAVISDKDGVSPVEGFDPEPSLCLGDCRDQCRKFNKDGYTYIHGKWVIVLSLPAHEKTDLTDSWSCMDFSVTKLFFTEAATFALDYLKQKLEDDRFGLLIIDSCGYKLKAAGTLYDVLRGTHKICNHLEECFDPKSIVQFIGDFRSSVTQQLQTITRELPSIQMAYGASSVTLNDRDNYPYFLRTNPSDDLQAHFMVELLKSLVQRSFESQINAVNIIYTDGLYGRTGAEIVKESLTKAGICVHLDKKVNLTASDNNFGALVEDLIYKTDDVKITVAFLDTEHITDLMSMVNTDAFKRVWQNAGLSFIFSDTWNDDATLLKDYGELVTGSFSFKFDSNFSSTTFKGHLEKVGVPSITDRNYWLSTLVQEEGKCKIRGNFRSTYGDRCNSMSADLTQLEGEAYSTHVMKAITSTVYGIRIIAHDNDDDILFDADTVKDRYKLMLDVSIPTTLEGKSRNHKPFTPKGNGKVGYSIYNIKLDEGHGRPVYRLVQRTGFDYHDKLEKFLKIPVFYKGNSPTSDIASTVQECKITTTPPGGITPTPTPGTTGNPNGQTAALIAVSAFLGFLMLAIIISLLFIFLCYRKRRRQIKKKPEQSVTRGCERDENYDEIPYVHYMSQAQRETILKFVTENPGAAPPSYMLASDYFSNNGDSDYHVPRNNRPIAEATGTCNSAFSGSEASGPSKSTAGGGSVASDSTLSADKLAVAYDLLTKSNTSVPVPSPRGTSNSETGSTATGITHATSYATLNTVCVVSSEEEEHML